MTARERYAKWKAAHPEDVKKHRKKWTAANTEKCKASARRRYCENPEKHRDRATAFRSTHRESIREYAREYAKENPEKRCANECARRARKLSADGRYTPEDVERIYSVQRGRCGNRACRVDLSLRYHVDHITPLSKGGSNWPDNLQLLCPTCNTRKRDKDPDIWAQQNGLLFHL